MRWPLTAPASGEHSQAIAAAISSGRVSAGFSSPMARMMTTFEVAVVPARSRPTEIVSASTAAFVAAYAACFGVGVAATKVETVTMRPCSAATTSGRKARMAWTVDHRLRSSRCVHSSSVPSTNGVPPA